MGNIGAFQDNPISTVGELIEKLKEYPAGAEVGFVWDSALRSRVNFAWMTKSGVVALSDHCQSVSGDDCPSGFDRYKTPNFPDDYD